MSKNCVEHISILGSKQVINPLLTSLETNYNTVKHHPLPVVKCAKVRPMSCVVQAEIPKP